MARLRSPLTICSRWRTWPLEIVVTCGLLLGIAICVHSPSVFAQSGAPSSGISVGDGCKECVGPRQINGVSCGQGCCGPEATWKNWGSIPWEVFAHGEYVGPARASHVDEYRLRVRDQLEFVYRLTREESKHAYELNVGDEVRIELLSEKEVDRQLAVQPDGTISVPLLGQVRAARRTVRELQDLLEEQYTKFYKSPNVTVTPIKVNARLEDLRATVDARQGFGGGQSRRANVTPEGTVQLVAVGSVPAQGLTLDELKREVDARYDQIVDGIEVTPILVERAPRFIYVVGEVNTPGRYALEGPTSVMQAIALAGGWRNGGNLRQVIVFRRDENWQLMATRLDLKGALLGKRPCPADEIWLRDSDTVLVPANPIRRADDLIELVFTRGIYGVAPFASNGFTRVGQIR